LLFYLAVLQAVISKANPTLDLIKIAKLYGLEWLLMIIINSTMSKSRR